MSRAGDIKKLRKSLSSSSIKPSLLRVRLSFSRIHICTVRPIRQGFRSSPGALNTMVRRKLFEFRLHGKRNQSYFRALAHQLYKMCSNPENCLVNYRDAWDRSTRRIGI